LRIPSVVDFLTCPVCSCQIERELYRREGFRCPKCGSFLHLDERFAYVAAVLCVPVAVLISNAAGLEGLSLFLGAAVLWVLLLALSGVAVAYCYPKLAVGLPPHGRIILHIPPPDDRPKDQGEQHGE
jgi:hypothetical protein